MSLIKYYSYANIDFNHVTSRKLVITAGNCRIRHLREIIVVDTSIDCQGFYKRAETKIFIQNEKTKRLIHRREAKNRIFQYEK